jgi:hypothetical protein
MTQLKLCAACGDEKLIGVFNLDRTRADGRYPYCKPCTKTRKEKWYLENRAKVLEQVKTRAITAPHKVQDSRRKYYLANSEKVKADTVRWQKAHPHIIAWRTLLRNVLRRTGQKKDARTIEMMGYSADDLRRHVESLWTPGMKTGPTVGSGTSITFARSTVSPLGLKRWDNA